MSRDQVLKNIREALAPLPERTPYPHYEDADARSLLPEDQEREAIFQMKLEAAHGIFLEGWDALRTFLRERKLKQGYLDPEFAEQLGEMSGVTIETSLDRSRIDDYAFGITQGAGAIAETGTIVLNDVVSKTRLGALAPWVHIAVIKRHQLWLDVAEALLHLENDPSVIWATGPSKTADVEGILIEGVHGPGVQACCLIN